MAPQLSGVSEEGALRLQAKLVESLRTVSSAEPEILAKFTINVLEDLQRRNTKGTPQSPPTHNATTLFRFRFPSFASSFHKTHTHTTTTHRHIHAQTGRLTCHAAALRFALFLSVSR